VFREVAMDKVYGIIEGEAALRPVQVGVIPFPEPR